MPPTARSRAAAASRRGIAVLGAIVGALVVAGIALAALTFVFTGQDAAGVRTDENELEWAARDAVTVAVASLWDPLEHAYEDTPLDLTRARAHLDSHGVTAGGGEHDLLASTSFVTRGEERRLGRARILELGARRDDLGVSTRLVVRAVVEGEARGDEPPLRTEHEEVLVVRGARHASTDYALFGTDISCAFCHLEVDSAPRRHNRDPARIGTFERVRVATLEPLRLRASTGDSGIAGTLVLGRGGCTTVGATIVDWSRLDLDAVRLDGNGRIVESRDEFASDGSALLVRRNLLAADLHDPLPLENLYLEQLAAREQVDGPLPRDFPTVFPDDVVNDGCVDDSEFERLARDLDGRVTAAVVHVVRAGERVTTRARLADALSRSTDDVLSRCVDGTLVLVGTREAPVEIEGELAIDGDLVISGYVRGSGALRVRGAIHVPADLVLLDGVDANGARTFGSDAHGLPNGLALAGARGVLLGDVFAARFGDSNDGGATFLEASLAAFNARELARTSGPAPRRILRVDSSSDVPLLLPGENADGATRPLALTPDDRRLGTDTRVVALAGDWIDRSLLPRLAEHFLGQRARWKPLAVDAAIYSDTCVVGLVSPRSVGLSGRLVINGAVVAREVALLATSGALVLHDPRAADLLDVRDHRAVRLSRVQSRAPALAP
jgi:hypothetical protein